jgi:PKD repeat protein
MTHRITSWVLAATAAFGLTSPLQAQSADSPALMVVYGISAPSREGDVDRREQLVFSLPDDTPGRFFIRLYDPEIYGADDFTYGGPRDSVTTFRVIGGEGAFSGANMPVQVLAGAPATTPDLTPGPGDTLIEQAFDSDPATNGRWMTLGAVRASQGEQRDGRAYFRIDIDGTAGNDGNGYSVAISTARDRNREPTDTQMIAFQPTIRWTRGTTATRMKLAQGATGPFTVQNFDGARATLNVVTDYTDIPVESSGQNTWSVETIEAATGTLALSLEGGFETPNDVTVAVFDGAGQPVALQMPPVATLDPARPTAVGRARPLADCRAVAFDGNASTGRMPLSYIWEFGDGTEAAESVFAHRYAEPGRYTATLKVLENGTRAGRGASVQVPVHVRSGPKAQPGAPIVVAPGEVVTFDGTGSEPSDSPITRYIWTFGDGTSATGATAEKAYDAPGLYRSNLRVEDDSAHPCFYGVDVRNITVNFAPVAEAGTDQTAETGQLLRFGGGASYDVDGKVTAHVWDMGDGTVLMGTNISHTYAEPGRYTVSLNVTDDSTVANNMASDTLQVRVNAPPAPIFTIPERPMSVSEAAELSAAASGDADGTILSYMWDFGDGATGEGPDVSYAWTTPGVYSVALTVTDDSGTASATQSITQQIVVDAAPVANAGPDQFVTASEVQFDGTASTDAEGGISSYEWDFGDGHTGTGKTPVHPYATPGVYTVALVVRDESGAPLNRNRDTMQVTVNATPIADAGPDLVVAPGEEFILSGRSSVDPDGAVMDYLWALPDGTTQPRERIAHALDAPGLYRFGLTVADNFAGGAARDETEVRVTVNAAPVAEAGADVLVAPGDPVQLDGGLSFDTDGTLTQFLWEFSDGAPPADTAVVARVFDVPGVWSAQLVVTDDSGVANATAADDLTIRVNHAPVAQAGAQVDTEALQVSFDGSASSDADGNALIYTWDFGDGTGPVTGVQTTHVFARSGIYPVTLRVDDGTGLSNASAIDTTVVTIRTRPVALAGDNREVCSGQPILFDASQSVDPDGGLLRYEWDFGDGDRSELINPTKTYEQPGAYPVTLSVRNGTGTEWGRDVARIAAIVREGPIADAGADKKVCTNQAVRFDGSGSTDADGAVNAFAWTFGDGGVASGDRPEYQFRKPGNYVVNLTITGEALGSCSPLDTDTMNVEVVAAPAQSIEGPERAAAGIPFALSATLGDLGAARVVSHTWSFSDETTAQGAEISHTFEAPGVYFINLTTELIGGEAGCNTIETTRKIIVNAAPAAVLIGPGAVAMGAAIVFDASPSSDSDGVITGFVWDFGDGTTATGLRATHRFATAGTFEVTLAVTDDANVANSTATIMQKVRVNPAPAAGLQAPQWVCADQDVPLAIAVPDGTDVSWMFGDGASATGASTAHRYSAPGLYPVSVELNDGTGLANATRREEAYLRVNQQPTALAGADRSVCPGDLISFDAGASGDLDGQITRYIWRFSDGVTLNGAQVERSFDTAGPVTAELSVMDNSGLTCGIAQDTAMVLVNNTPLVDAGPDQTTLLGAAHDVLSFDASAAQDADAQGLMVTWDYGDGTSGSGAVTQHRYTAPGTYTVTVEARDTTGLACGISTDTATVIAQSRAGQ